MFTQRTGGYGMLRVKGTLQKLLIFYIKEVGGIKVELKFYLNEVPLEN